MQSLTNLIDAKLSEAAEDCKTENAPEESLRIFVEKIVTDGYNLDVILCFNDLPVVPYRYHYEPVKYEPLERKVIGEAEIIADGIRYYHPETGERHKKKQLKIRIMV